MSRGLSPTRIASEQFAARHVRSFGSSKHDIGSAVVRCRRGHAVLQSAVRGGFAGILAAILFPLMGAASEPLKLANTQLEPVTWSELAGWAGDDHLAAFAAWQASCRVLRNAAQADEQRPIRGALRHVCRKALELAPHDAQAARRFFEQNFEPVHIARLGEAEGLLTSYFEPVVAGSRFPSPEFHIPVYRRPPDLVAAGHQPGSAAFPNKGVRIGRRNAQGELVPYYDRAAIEAGALDGRKLEICWLKDPADLLAIQIEGSGRIILEDGTPLRINYDAHNGYPFTSLSGALIQSHRIARGEISTERVREWLAAHPEEVDEVRAANRSYMFFRIVSLSNEGEPVGAQGVPLTPGRSIAVDRLHDYGTPFFIAADLPLESEKPASPFRRLMVAQDTGSAIVGPARADLYFGSGEEAGRIAGRIHHSGRFVMLLPRALDMVAAGRHMPLPPPKPTFAEAQAGKQDDKRQAGLEVNKHTGKANAETDLRRNDKRATASASARAVIDPRTATAYARWRPRPLY